MTERGNAYRCARNAAVGLTAQLALALALAPTTAARAEPAGSVAAKQSLVLCDQVGELPADDKIVALTRGLQLAEDALAADDQDAKAHFALFCNLGRQMQVTGVSFSSWSTYRRLRRELDATLALVPNDPDALAAKGALLLHLPRLLGGDAAEAERLLRRALDVEPGNTAARRYLAEALEERGASDQARALLASR